MTSPSRILILTRNLPPLVGGMERLNWHMADELSKYADVKVIGPSGSAALKPEQVTITEAPLKPLPLFLLVTLLKAIWLAIRWKPEVILAGSGLTAPIAWLVSKLCGARSAAYLHGFDITVQDRIYQRLWTPVFKRMDHIIVNSTPTKGLAFAAGVPERRITIVYPGVSLPETPQPVESIEAFKQQHGLTGKKILLSVGRLTTRKGLREFVELALPSIVEAEPSTILVVVGDTPKDSLGAGIQTVEEIMEQSKKVGVSDHIKFLGRISEQELVTSYQVADVHIFPVIYIEGDPEGFGMVAIEAAAHGLPTVAFANGGVVDAVFSGKSGKLAKWDDYVSLAQGVIEILNGVDIDWGSSSQSFAAGFAWPVFGQKIMNALGTQTMESR